MLLAPGASNPWIVIDSPLVVFPDGSLSVLISVAALLVSGATFWHTLSAKPRVHAYVMRSYERFGDNDTDVHVDGDEVVVVNLGRTAAVIYDVRALRSDGAGLSRQSMPRGPDSTMVPSPELPQSLAPGGVLTAWFSAALVGEPAGQEHGYRITYANTTARPKVRTEPVNLIVKATKAPPPTA